MNKYTEHAYTYRHDGGDYIGCRALGGNYDCRHDELSDVNCTECEIAYDYECQKGNAHENNLSRH